MYRSEEQLSFEMPLETASMLLYIFLSTLAKNLFNDYTISVKGKIEQVYNF